MPDQRCDNRSVGVIIHDVKGGRILVSERVKPPVGVSPPAGHVDGHGGWDRAAAAEVEEETGLRFTPAQLGEWVNNGWRNTPCRRPAGPASGHEWRIFEVAWDGQEPREAPGENRNMRWAGPEELQALADRTVALARGRITPAAFEQEPGLEPLWVQWLHDAGLIRVSPADLVAVDQYACQPIRDSDR